jgi:putative flavoprotein involved in K+ transport
MAATSAVRRYSQYLALQRKARMEGLPTPVYGLAKEQHAR